MPTIIQRTIKQEPKPEKKMPNLSYVVHNYMGMTLFMLPSETVTRELHKLINYFNDTRRSQNRGPVYCFEMMVGTKEATGREQNHGYHYSNGHGWYLIGDQALKNHIEMRFSMGLDYIRVVPSACP